MAFITGGRAGPTAVKVVNWAVKLKYTTLTSWLPWPHIILPGLPTGSGGATMSLMGRLGARVHNFNRPITPESAVEGFHLIGYRR